jgi:hypothetical protein
MEEGTMSAFKLNPPDEYGINIWILASAGRCKVAGISEAECERMIYAYQGQTRRPIKRSEVTRAIQKAYSSTFTPTNYVKPEKVSWQPNQTRRSTYKPQGKKYDAYQLWEESPWTPDDGLTQTIVLKSLFPDSSRLICVGKSAFAFHTARLDQFKDLSQCQFIVPCYMTKKTGITQDGKESMHCLDNCDERLYCVVDLDEPKSVDHPSIIKQLKRVFDLVMVLSSGGKSLHAWFNVPSDEEKDFWDVAVPMGADAALMRNRSSFVRIPGGTRENGNKQSVLYFDESKCVKNNKETISNEEIHREQ